MLVHLFMEVHMAASLRMRTRHVVSQEVYMAASLRMRTRHVVSRRYFLLLGHFYGD